jgi:type IV pilus assembly protein PilX
MEQDVMNTRHPSARCAPIGTSHQRGVVLFIALIVMVAMSLAAIALMRSVDTTSAVIGNLAFRQASILPANYGIEDAAAGLFNDANPANIARIADVRVDTPAENYYATHSQAAGWDDQYGVPQPLQTKPPSTWPRAKTDGAQNTITYVTERMCNPNAPVIPADKSAANTWCDMMPPKQSPGTTINDPMAAILSAQPFYRVTVRVDGPQNTVSFAQAMLR